MSNDYRFFITCPKDMESLLAEELQQLGAKSTKLTLAGVYATGSSEFIYKTCLWSRLANRLLLVLAIQPANSPDDLYKATTSIDWLEHMSSENTMWVDFSGQCGGVTNTQFAAQKIKDAVVDQLREKTGERPSIAKDQPDIRITVHVHKQEATISLDLSGDSLHRRGYRVDAGIAPLKENLAAAILIRAGWPAVMHNTDMTFIDPMCGSGTFLIEAAMMSADIAPGLQRTYFGFQAWKGYDKNLWQTARTDAVARKQAGLTRKLPDIRGYDADPRVIGHAKNNIARAGLEGLINVSVKELAKLVRPTHASQAPGFIVTNPPYGERMSNVDNLPHLYHYLGQRLMEQFPDWQAAIFTGNPELGKTMGIRAHKKFAFFNGTIPTELLLFKLTTDWKVKAPAAKVNAETITPPAEVTLTEGAKMVANRLRKNHKKLEKWLKKEGIKCYRVYDADMPEYSAAVDCYDNYYHIQEYAAPKTIDPFKAEQRLQEIVAAVTHVFNAPTNHVFIKQRLKQRGSSQYQKLNDSKKLIEVNEQGAKLLVNFTDYLDTGLFLDHRPVRRMIQRLADKKRFLNLFCYTATATVHAGVGGARNSISIDMSATYCDWARSNLSLNGLSDSLHKVIQADCLTWLNENSQEFDLILLDPPTFSNSKRMADILDIQRDHVDLVHLCMRSLAPEGILIFSNNFRKFILDESLRSLYNIEEITTKTFDPDFSRDLKLHHCWLIQHQF